MAGIATPEYIKITPGQYVGTHKNERFLLSPYIPGSAPKTVSPELIQNFGATLAKLHTSLAGVVIPKNDMQWLSLKRVTNDLDSYNGPFKATLRTLLNRGSVIFSADLPRAVTHGDLWLNNVFAKGNEITTVFDLETAEETVRLVDIARTYTSIRFNSGYSIDEVIEGLVAGYNSVASQLLTAEEIANIKLAIMYVCGACATWHAVHQTEYVEGYLKLADEVLAQN